MKNPHLWTVTLLSILTISCSTDNVGETAGSNKTASAKSSVDALAEQGPSNPANSYDMAGKVTNDLMERYLNNTYKAATIGQAAGYVTTLAAGDPYLAALGQRGVVDAAAVSLIVTTPVNGYQALLKRIPVSDAAAVGFSDFLAQLQPLQENDYPTIYAFVCAYEAGIAGSSYSTTDKTIILTATSVARYSLYYRKKRKDRDWDTSVANIVAAAGGARENFTLAVLTGLTADISAQEHLPY